MDIYVGNLSGDVTGNDLRAVFELFGRVERADVPRHRHSGAPAGFGFVGMPARSEGLYAVLGVHGRMLKGHVIAVNEVQPNDPISGACRTRCRCRSVTPASPRIQPLSATFT